MAHAESAVTIDRPIQQVFDYIADGTNNPDWRAGVLEIERTSADEGVGATYRQVLQGPGGRRIAGDYRVTTFLPPNRLEFAVIAGPAKPTGLFDLTEEGPDRTKLTFSLELRPIGIMRLMSGVIAKQMRTEVAQIERLKANLEA
jgi:uncharacterized protein YndB with AHSA1/START domain